ncbi:MAG: hypothetical protein WDN44_14140 [Sphingomonas sp.]
MSIFPITHTRRADEAFPVGRIRSGIILVTLTLAGIGLFASTVPELIPAGALSIAPLSIFAIQRTLWEQPDSPPAIIGLFPRQVPAFP